MPHLKQVIVSMLLVNCLFLLVFYRVSPTAHSENSEVILKEATPFLELIDNSDLSQENKHSNHSLTLDDDLDNQSLIKRSDSAVDAIKGKFYSIYRENIESRNEPSEDTTLEDTQIRMESHSPKHMDNDILHQDNKDSEIKETDLKEDESEVKLLRRSNPFYVLGAYPEVAQKYFNTYPSATSKYNITDHGLKNDDNYCEIVDLYNLLYPDNMFDQMNFFTDYFHDNQEMVRPFYVDRFTNDTMKEISKAMPEEEFNSRKYSLAPNINNFFTKRVDLHVYHKIGQHFLCATQMYNHIPGHGTLKRKDLVVDSVIRYTRSYKSRPQCFKENMFFPTSYRLHEKEECEEFFKVLSSREYQKSAEINPIQYLIKVGYASHKASGISILDANETQILKTQYQDGKQCGIRKKALVAQTYVNDPLLLDFNNKFDFRVYMLIASTNPIIAFYHDGFLRVALETYNKSSSNKGAHLTNTFVAKSKFEEASSNNSTFFGMNEQELRDYHIWDLERLGNYLYDSGKVQDPNWLDNYLRPAFHKAFIHLVKMSSYTFWNQSNVYEFFGLDFMLDNDLNLWFIECNSSPQFVETNERSLGFLTTMLNDMFEIQYSYYKSRMKRVLNVIRGMQADLRKDERPIDYKSWKAAYKEAAANRLEPEYQINKNNSFTLIIDQNLPGAEAYMGYLAPECI